MGAENTDSVVEVSTIWIDRGAHEGDTPGGCVMEWVALLAGLTKTDRPRCTNLVVTLAAQRINDMLPDDRRQELKALIPRLLGAKRTTKDRRVNVRLAIWAARRVLHLVPVELSAAAEAAVAAAEGWLAGTATVEDCYAARQELWKQRIDVAVAAVVAVADAAVVADARINFLSELLDAHEKALAEEGVLWEDEFCAFVEEMAAEGQ